MRIALAQINAHLGNFAENYQKIIEYAERAKERRCDIVLFPESTLFGYHPMDLLKRDSVVTEEIKFIQKISKSIPKGIVVIFGAFTKNPSARGKPYYNTAIALQQNKRPWVCHKELLPTYDVFDDARHIEPGDMAKNIFHYKGKKILITICEDIWAWPVGGQSKKSYYEINPIKKIRPGSVDLVLNLSASPFYTHKMQKRLEVTRATAKYLRAPMVYVNMVGGQDELIFDGGSFAINKNGKILTQCAQFTEDLGVVDFATQVGTTNELSVSTEENLRAAIVLGIRDFVHKTGQSKIHLGLSGGIDSALVACLAVDALGAEKVKVYAMPGPFSSKKSLFLARKLAKNLHVEFKVLPIHVAYKKMVQSVDAALGMTKFGVMHENIQARIRGLMLMAVCNREGGLLLNTSNKSEFAVGYSTLYGDMAGAFSPIGDLLKRDIVSLSKHYNSEIEIIPEEIISRSPSAELRPGQKDQDTLPPYSLLDNSVVNIVEKGASAKSKSDKFLLQKLMASEFKRWQSPPILKVSEHSFGQGRRMPIAHKAWY